MARTWLSVTVELLGGRGDELWPWPGRVLAVGPDHTFAQLAAAINDAFARWDRSHLSEFTLSDGRLVTDAETGEELSEEEQVSWLDLAQTRVAATVRPGEEFRFTFDLGDQWVHRCVVGQDAIDPVAELGVKPPTPLPYWGWGTIPDQYGRRWADDDGTSRAATRPAQAHPMLGDAWPGRAEAPSLDMGDVRAAIAQGDAAAFLAAVAGRDIDDALQQVGEGVPMALATDRAAAEPLARTVIARLEDRAAPGDDVLAEDLAAAVRGQAPGGRVLPVDLDRSRPSWRGTLRWAPVGSSTCRRVRSTRTTRSMPPWWATSTSSTSRRIRTGGCPSTATGPAAGGGTWPPSRVDTATSSCASGSSEPSRVGVRSVASATSSTRRAWPSSGTPSPPIDRPDGRAGGWPTRASGWDDPGWARGLWSSHRGLSRARSTP